MDVERRNKRLHRDGSSMIGKIGQGDSVDRIAIGSNHVVISNIASKISRTSGG